MNTRTGQCGRSSSHWFERLRGIPNELRTQMVVLQDIGILRKTSRSAIEPDCAESPSSPIPQFVSGTSATTLTVGKKLASTVSDLVILISSSTFRSRQKCHQWLIGIYLFFTTDFADGHGLLHIERQRSTHELKERVLDGPAARPMPQHLTPASVPTRGDTTPPCRRQSTR